MVLGLSYCYSFCRVQELRQLSLPVRAQHYGEANLMKCVEGSFGANRQNMLAEKADLLVRAACGAECKAVACSAQIDGAAIWVLPETPAVLALPRLLGMTLVITALSAGDL